MQGQGCSCWVPGWDPRRPGGDISDIKRVAFVASGRCGPCGASSVLPRRACCSCFSCVCQGAHLLFFCRLVVANVPEPQVLIFPSICLCICLRMCLPIRLSARPCACMLASTCSMLMTPSCFLLSLLIMSLQGPGGFGSHPSARLVRRSSQE